MGGRKQKRVQQPSRKSDTRDAGKKMGGKGDKDEREREIEDENRLVICRLKGRCHEVLFMYS